MFGEPYYLTALLAFATMLVTIHETEAALFQSSSSATSSSYIRLRANKLRPKADSCRENLPRKSEDLPVLVITGKVREVYMAGGNGNNGTTTTTTTAITSITTTVLGEQRATTTTTTTNTNSNTNPNTNTNNNAASNKALVNIGRVIRGNQQLLGTDILVSGFNATNSSPCPNYVKQNDTLILLLNHDGEKRYSIQGNNIFSMNLNNLDRINALAADEPLKRRPPIEDILCEAHYCPYGRCVVLNEKLAQVTCKCPDICPTNYSPVCGSNNVTYSNECQLILEGCSLKRPLFVTREVAC